MEFKEFTGKTVEEAVTAALVEFQVTGDRLEYEVIEKETKGLFGLGQKDAVIRARKAVEDVEDIARKFLEDVLDAMGELINTNNGLFTRDIVNNRGGSMEVTPPAFYTQGAIVTAKEIIVLPMNICDGRTNYAVAIGRDVEIKER